MAWPLLNHTIAEDVEKLVDQQSEACEPEDERAIPREKALAIIHAAIWGYASRSDSTAGAYAFMNLMETLGIKRWSFKDDWSDITINGAVTMQMLVKCQKERYYVAPATRAAR